MVLSGDNPRLCTMVLKETLAYYTNDGGVAFCTMHDATKVFDRVEYCKLFQELVKRDLPAGYLRLPLNMYTNNVAHVLWSGIASRPFSVKNGVRQGGIFSPVYFVFIWMGCFCSYATLALVAILGIFCWCISLR